MKRIFSAIAVLSLLISSLFVNASPALASYTGNLAGKPCAYPLVPNAQCGYQWSTCHSGIYGRVGNQMVLFVPHHCFSVPGQTVYGPSGIALGTQAADYANISASDMAFIWLGATGNYPASNRNYIYVPGGGPAWVNTSKWGSSATDCDSAGGEHVDVSHWYDLSTGSGNIQSGIVQYIFQDGPGYYGVGKRCRVVSTIPSPAGDLPSGSPWFSPTYGFLSVTTGRINVLMQAWDSYYMTSWYQAIRDLNAYANGGAFFCANSACT